MIRLGLRTAAAAIVCWAVVMAQAHAADTHSHAAHAHSTVDRNGWGHPGDPKAAKRTVTVRMLDTMRYDPESIVVKRGETVRFVVVNTGKIPHELVLGTKAEIDRHAAMMRGSTAHEGGMRSTGAGQHGPASGNDEHGHGAAAHDHGSHMQAKAGDVERDHHDGMHDDHASAVQAEPQHDAVLTWTFDKPGDFLYACLFPGHYEAGMVGRIHVRP